MSWGVEHFAEEVVNPPNHPIKPSPDTLLRCPPSDSHPPVCAPAAALSNAWYHQAAAAAPWPSVTAWAGLGQAILSICRYIYISTHHHSSICPGRRNCVTGSVVMSGAPLSRDAGGGIVGVGVPSLPSPAQQPRVSHQTGGCSGTSDAGTQAPPAIGSSDC